MPTVLYVEDEPAIAKGVRQGLSAEGFEVLWAESAEDGSKLLDRNRIDVVLLDVRLPGMDGFAFCRQLRQKGVTVPVIMLTARDEEIDRVVGLEIGADDYLVKPFSLRELTARIRAQIRRTTGEYSSAATGSTLTTRDLRIDRNVLRVYRGTSEIHLTPIEYRLLLTMAESPDTVFTRSVLIDRAWGDGYILEDERTVDVHIRHLREKIEDDPANPIFIITVRGYGYRFVKESQ